MTLLMPHLLMLVWAALVASSFPVAALFDPGLSASLLVSIRFLIAGLLMWFFRPQTLKLPAKAWASYSLLGLLLGGNFVVMFVALRYSPALNLAAIYISMPIFAYMLAIVLKMERLSGYRVTILLIAAVAAMIILSRADLHKLSGLNFGFGETIYLLACLLAAGYNTLSRFVTERGWIDADPYLTTCFSLLAGGLLIGIPDLLFTDLKQFTRLISTADIFALGYLTLFTSLGTFWILQICALRLQPSMLSAYSYQAPLIYLLAELLLQLTQWRATYAIAFALLLCCFYLLARQDRYNLSEAAINKQGPQ